MEFSRKQKCDASLWYHRRRYKFKVDSRKWRYQPEPNKQKKNNEMYLYLFVFGCHRHPERCQKHAESGHLKKYTFLGVHKMYTFSAYNCSRIRL